MNTVYAKGGVVIKEKILENLIGNIYINNKSKYYYHCDVNPIIYKDKNL